METKAKTITRAQCQTLQCKVCGTDVYNCSTSADAVTCSECVVELYWLPEDAPKKKSVGYPKGWKFMKEFIHQNGTVYFRGVEQLELKGTLEPTTISTKEITPKKSKSQRAAEKQEVLAKFNKLKKELVKETRSTYKKKIELELKRLQKLI